MNQMDKEIFSDNSQNIILSNSLNKNRLLSEKITLSYTLNQKTIFLLGEEFTSSDLSMFFNSDATGFTKSLSDIRERNIGIFAQYQQTISNYTLQAGLRFEHVKRTYYKDNAIDNNLCRTNNDFFPSVSLSGIIGKVGAMLGYEYRPMRPTYSQLDENVQYVSRIRIAQGNPNLKMVYSQNVNLYLEWKMLALSATFTHLRNPIFSVGHLWDVNPEMECLTFENFKKQQSLSVELYARKKFGPLNISLNASLNQPWLTYMYRGEMCSFNRAIFTIGGNASISLPNNFTIYVNGRWKSRGNSENMYYYCSNSLNISLAKSLLNDKLTIYLSGNDLLDGKKDHQLLYSANSLTDMRHTYDTRSVSLSISYYFNPARNRYAGRTSGSSERARM